MVGGVFLLTAWLVSADVLPLTEAQTVRLQAAQTARDHREDAFAALIENAVLWEGDPANVPARDHPDSDAVLSSPDAYRGDLFRIRGRLEQITRLKRPYESVFEWFIASEASDRLMIVYVASPAEPGSFKPGDDVEILGRFYKGLTMTARDGVAREYPAYVGALPGHLAAAKPSGGAVFLWVIGLPVVVLLIVFIVLLGYVRRRRQPHDRGLASRRFAESISDSGPPARRSAISATPRPATTPNDSAKRRKRR